MVEAQSLVNALVGQRNDAMNALAQSQAALADVNTMIQQLQAQVAELSGDDNTVVPISEESTEDAEPITGT